MRRMTSAIVLICGCAVVGAAAQTKPAQQASPRTTARTVSQQITVNGCLERAKQAGLPTTTGTTGTATGTPAPESFVLINASAPTSTQGAAGGPVSTTYVLDGGNLSSKVGQRIEVKGTATSPASSISAGGVPPPPEPHEAESVTAGTPGTADTPAASTLPHIRVASVRVLSDCSTTR